MAITPLFPISGFVLNKKFQWNASKFDIFHIGVGKSKVTFHLLLHATLCFSLCPLSIYKMWQILKRFVGIFCQTQTMELEGVTSPALWLAIWLIVPHFSGFTYQVFFSRRTFLGVSNPNSANNIKKFHFFKCNWIHCKFSFHRIYIPGFFKSLSVSSRILFRKMILTNSI